MSQRIALRDMSAVHIEDNQNVNILGFLVWYSVGEQLIDRDALRSYVKEAGLDEGFMPAEIRIPDAFRRATKMIECKKETSQAGVFNRFLVREVASDKTAVQRNIVKETVDSKGKRLSYSEKEAILILDKEDGLMKIAHTTEDGRLLAMEALQHFDVFKNAHDGHALRGMCRNVLSSMSPTAMRSSGGVYFVPVQYEQRLRSMMNFIGMLEKGEGHMIQLINTKEHLDMVRKDALKQINDTLQRLEEAYHNEELTAADITAIVNDVELTFKIIEDYRSFLMEDMNKLDKGMLTFQKMLNSVRSRKKDRKESRIARQIRL